MPFKVVKDGDKYKLYNLEKKRYVKKEFKSKSSALSASRNYMAYDKRK
tara:strand:+ start:2090 stop:2233 length:144 start_codon:yes stop_codon:yes gene_type:complete